jgi:hypothetical protein
MGFVFLLISIVLTFALVSASDYCYCKPFVLTVVQWIA